MKTNNKYFRIILFGLLLSFTQSCATGRKSRSHPEDRSATSAGTELPVAQVNGEEGPYGPTDPGAQETYGPELTELRPIVLVLGPGMARGFAYVGVFQALEKAKIPIGAVIGTEMGALIGSVYSFSSNINQFEWNLLKLKENAFQESNGFLSQWRNTSMSGEKLESQLKQILENKDLKSARIPMRIGVAIEHAPASHKEETKVLDQGNVVSTIRASMSSQGASKGFFAPIKWNQAGEKVKVTSTEKTHPFLVEEAKRIATGPIVVVDVMGPPQSGLVMDELKGADLVIRPDMRGIQAKDFQKKTDAAFRGKNAIIQHMAEIRHLVGMSGAVD